MLINIRTFAGNGISVIQDEYYAGLRTEIKTAWIMP